MSNQRKKASKTNLSLTQPNRLPDWAVGMDVDEAMEITKFLTDNPLPQRTNLHNLRKNTDTNNNTDLTNNSNHQISDQPSSSGLQNNPTTNNNNTNPPTNNNNPSTDNNNNNQDNSTTTNNPTPVDPPTRSHSNNTYGQSITGTTSYKNNLLLTLLGDPQRPSTPLSGSTNTSDIPNPVDQVNTRLKQFTLSLKPTISTLCTTAVTIKNIGNLVSSGSIPFGCTPSCRLGITNPLVSLTRAWNDCLKECGKQLTAILINYHCECHQQMLQDLQETINIEFQQITNDFQATVPELDSKLKFTENEINQSIQAIEQQMLNQRKRGPQNNNNNTDNDEAPPTDKRSRTENTITSSIQQKVQSTLSEVLGTITRPNRGHGQGRGLARGRGNRGGSGRYFQ